MYGPNSTNMRFDDRPPQQSNSAAQTTRNYNSRGPPPPLYSIHSATIKKIESYGAFAALDNGFQGLLHISQLANYKVESVDDCVSINDRVFVKVTERTEEPPLEGKPARTKVSFSLRYETAE